MTGVASRKSKSKLAVTGGGLTSLLIISTLLLSACGPNPTAAPQPSPTAESTLKVSSILLDIFVTYETTQGSPDDKKNAAIKYARDHRILNEKDEVVFDLVVDPPNRQSAIEDKIKTMGGSVTNSDNISGEVHLQVNVPLNVLVSYANSANKDNFMNDLAAFDGVKSINIMLNSQPRELNALPDSPEALYQLAQTTKNQGVKLMGADKWQAAGYRGKGVKIGVIDGGFKYYKQFLGKTLPANLHMKDMDADKGGPGVINESVHGTAVLEIIASLAPEADIYAVAIDLSKPIEEKQAYDYLIGQGVSIISGSYGGHAEPGDGSGVMSRYVESLRKSKNVTFLFAAGNEAGSHYGEFFNPDSNGFHQFVPGVNQLEVINPGSSPLDTDLILVWEQWTADKSQINDLDLYLLDKDGNVIDSSTDSQRAREPLEVIQLTMQPKAKYYIRIRQKPGTNPYNKPFRLHLFGDNMYFQYYVPQIAVGSPADSKGALAVGAIQWDEDKWANYSSQGPLTDGTFKPEISAPAGVSSAAYAQEGESEFDGTSAATPEASGVAAILKGANPSLTPDQLEALLKTATRDLSPGGPDYANGYGRLDIGKLTPSSNIAPQSQPVSVPNADMSKLQFPVLFFKYYDQPQPAQPSVSKIIPTPLPTRVVGEENGASDDSKINGVSAPSQPVPTSAPKPTAPANSKTTPGLPPPVANTKFSDSFRDKTSGLPNNNNSFYQDNSYKVKAGANQLNWGSYPASLLNLSDFGAEVTAQGLNGKDSLYGLLFWQKDANNYFLLSVTGSGQYQLSQYANGQYNEVLGWNAAPGWQEGQPNRLRIAAAQGRLSIFFNDQPGKVAQANGQGTIGFGAGSYAQAIQASYTNFSLSSAK